LSALLLGALTVVLVSCGGSGVKTNANAASTTATAIALSASPTTVPSDNSGSTTITVTSLNSSNAAVPNVTVILGANTGVVSAPSVTTGTDGTATFTFSSGLSSSANRTATVSATSGTATAQIPIQIQGSTLAVIAGNASTLPDDGSSPVNVVFIAKNAQGVVIAGAAISVVATGTGQVTLTPSSGFTDANGKFSTSVAGVTGGVGPVTLTATAVGSTASATVTVNPSTTTFSISQSVLMLGKTVAQTAITNPTAVSMSTADTLVLTATVPAPYNATPYGTVTFATSSGYWGTPGTSFVNVPVVGGTASATLSTASAGVASVQALVPGTTVSDNLSVSMTAVTPYKITLQAAPSTVPKSVGTTTGVSSLVATVTDSTGQPVGNAVVAFSILNPTGGGETVSPVVAYTASIAGGGYTLGQAVTSFTSGSVTSGAGGVQVRAQVLGAGGPCPGATCVATEANLPTPLNVSPSGNDAAINIGGTAGSVAFGSATALSVNSNATDYIQAMSVLVADSGGAPIRNAVVNLSLWPIAWSTGSGCMYDSDYDSRHGTFLNEDANENVSLDPGEDGTRKYYKTGTTTSSWCKPDPAPATTCTDTAVTSAAGTIDTYITPANSVAGTLTSTNAADAPGTVTTNSSGVATFNLEYGKNNAIWTVVRIRAKTTVAGTDAVGEIQFRLGALQSDGIPCKLPPSPFTF
jgi:hypothetical protein